MKKLVLIIFLFNIALNLFSQFYQFDSIPENLKKRADAVVRSEQCLFTITKPGNAVKKIKKAITLLNEDAESYRYLRVYYDKYARISSIKGTIYDEKGNIIKALGIANVFDMSAISGGTFYSDDRVKIMYFPLYKFPYTIEYEYEITYSSLINYPSWSFQDSPDVSVQRSGIQFVVPTNMKLRYSEEYMNSKADSVIQDDKKIYTWQEENLPAYRAQDYSIRQVYHSPVLYTAPLDFEYGGFTGSMHSWKEFGKWVYDINKDRDALPQTEIDIIKDITSKTDDSREKVRLVYEYMQSRTRYVSIQIGIGGFRTAEAAVVSKNGFGDCKALSNYTFSLLKAAGIDSYYTLVKADILSDVNRKFVDNRFNHVILCVPLPSDTIWLECTSQTNPFNYLSDAIAGKNVLMVTPEGGKMTKTPQYSKDQNLLKRTGSLYMSSLGTSSGRLSTYYSGSNFGSASFRYLMQYDEELKRILYSELRFPDFILSSVTYKEDKTENPSSRLDYQINIKNFTSANGPRMYFNPSFSVQEYLQEQPFNLKIPLSAITSDSIAYNLPMSYKIEYLPENIQIENEFGKFIYNLEIKGDKVIFTRVLELNESDITSEKYLEFRTFINSIARADREKVILVRVEV